MSAFITVSDAAGKVLYRRRATDEEIESALRAAEAAEREARSVMARIAFERTEADAGERMAASC